MFSNFVSGKFGFFGSKTVNSETVKICHDDKFEYPFFWASILKWLFNPAMRFMAKRMRNVGIYAFERSTYSRRLRSIASTYESLEMVYSYRPEKYKEESKDWIDLLLTHLWMNIQNGYGVRNRLRIVKSLLKDKLVDSGDQRVRILSIGTGSARAVLETVADMRAKGLQNRLEIRLTDMSRRALQFSKSLAEGLGLTSEEIQWIRAKADQVELLYGGDFVCDVVEMVGLLDYVENEAAIKLLSLIREHMKPGGVLLIANIMPNSEKDFLDHVVTWKMIYRKPAEFAELIRAAGFKGYDLHTDRAGIHLVARCFT